MAELPFGKLMGIYTQSNRECGKKWSSESVERQIAMAEQEIYVYLRQCFFTRPGSRCFIWEEQGNAISAVRCESYADGWLLTALETAPEYRRKGYGELMIRELQQYLGISRIYSHVAKSNLASLQLHKKCGFQIMKNHAVHMDGSVFHDSVTMVYECKKTESD
jgi:ribosomal protein S18 acetylase RimI-like enzyme